MKQWLKNIWMIKSEYILAALALIIFVVVRYLLSDEPITPADVGIIFGTILAIVVLFGPIVYVDVKNIKIGKPVDNYVESSQIKIGLFYILGIILSTIFMLIVHVIFITINLTILTDTEGVVGSSLMMFTILTIVFLPMSIYTLNA